MKRDVSMNYWKIQLRHSEVYWSSSICYSLSSVPRETVLDGHMLDVFLSNIVKVERISKEQYNEFNI